MDQGNEKQHAKTLAEHFNRLYNSGKHTKDAMLRNMALYLFEMGEYRSSLVLPVLQENLLMELARTMASIPDYSKEDGQMVVTLLNKHMAFEWIHSGADFLDVALTKGFDSEKAREILAEVSVVLSEEERMTLFDFLLEYPMQDVIFVLSGETDRVAAIILSHMDPAVADDLLDHLEERKERILPLMESATQTDPHVLVHTRMHVEDQIENALFLLGQMEKSVKQ